MLIKNKTKLKLLFNLKRRKKKMTKMMKKEKRKKRKERTDKNKRLRAKLFLSEISALIQLKIL